MSETSADDSAPLLREHDYIGLSEVSSGASSKLSIPALEADGALQDSDLFLELGLGLGLTTSLEKKDGAGGESTKESNSSRQGVLLELSHASNICAPGSAASKKWMKRGFSETMAPMPALKGSEPDVALPKQCSFAPLWAPANATAPSWHHADTSSNNVAHKGPAHTSTENARNAAADGAPPAKDRVVGWPPVRQYRRQTLAKPSELFVKVNMDGITVGRKVDLNAYNSYESLLRSLEEMFQPSTGVSQAPSGKELDVKHFLLANDSEFVLTYEDKDGDWMLVGDVPWSMFVSTVRRLRITRGSEATGSGSRALEKSRLQVR